MPTGTARRGTLAVAGLLGLAGCVDPEVIEVGGRTVDDACPVAADDVAVDRATAREALARLACHRALAGLDPTPVDDALAAAARAHAVYLAENDRVGHEEERALPGYTGATVEARATAAGWVEDPYVGLQEVVAWGTSPADIVDAWMAAPYHRVALTRPDALAVGYGQGGDFATLLAAVPVPAPGVSAVLYPAHGQTGVPTAWRSDTEIPDPMPDADWVGYPVSVTLTAPAPNLDRPDDPYEVQVIEATLEGAEGPVDAVLLEPATDAHLRRAVALVPVSPLRTGVVYTARFVLEWGGREQVVQGSFKTQP
jgi:hypothetical protein